MVLTFPQKVLEVPSGFLLGIFEMQRVLLLDIGPFRRNERVTPQVRLATARAELHPKAAGIICIAFHVPVDELR